MSRCSLTKREARLKARTAAVAEALGRWIERMGRGQRVTLIELSRYAVRTLDEFDAGYRAAVEHDKAAAAPAALAAEQRPPAGSVFDYGAIRAAAKRL